MAIYFYLFVFTAFWLFLLLVSSIIWARKIPKRRTRSWLIITVLSTEIYVILSLSCVVKGAWFVLFYFSPAEKNYCLEDINENISSYGNHNSTCVTETGFRHALSQNTRLTVNTIVRPKGCVRLS